MPESQQHSSEKKRRSPGSRSRRRSSTSFLEQTGRTHRNHVAPTTTLCVPKDDFPIPLNCIDVQRQTKTGIDVLHEATIDDYWNIDGDKSLSEPWIGLTRFELLNKNPAEGHEWLQGKLTKKQVTTGPGKYLAGRRVKYVGKLSAQSHEIHGLKKNLHWTQRASNEALTQLSDDDPEDSMKNARTMSEIRRESASPCKVTTPVNPGALLQIATVAASKRELRVRPSASEEGCAALERLVRLSIEHTIFCPAGGSW